MPINVANEIFNVYFTNASELPYSKIETETSNEKPKTFSYEDALAAADQKSFDKVLAHSQDYYIESIHTDALFQRWFAAKRKIIQKFNNQLIYNCGTVSFSLDADMKKDRFNDFIGTFYANYGQEIPQEFWDFITTQRDGFYDNKVVINYTAPSGEVIPCGMKLLKAAKYFVEDQNLLDKFQTAASMLIQETSITGELCFSVHPLDFLSVSENQYNWRSCHALDGEYRSGNLNYMVDESTVVCYLKGSEDTVLPNFPTDIKWNNKKWRMLLFFSDDSYTIFAGRQYPFFNREALDLCLRYFPNNGDYNDWTPWSNDRLIDYQFKDNLTYMGLNTTYIPIRGYLVDIYKLITNGENTHHFNDLLQSSCYIPYYTWRGNYWRPNREPHFTIGASAPCILCGEGEIACTDDMLCMDCEVEVGHSEDNDDIAECEYCGRRHLSEDSIEVWFDGEWHWVCPTCRDEHFERCHGCMTYKLRERVHDGLCPSCRRHERNT